MCLQCVLGHSHRSLSCERRVSRAAVVSQAGAPLSWTSERLRARKAAANERQPQRAERAIKHCASSCKNVVSPIHANREGVDRLHRKYPLARQESAIVSWNPRRASRVGRIRFRRGAGLARRVGASLLLVIGLLLVSGACGMDVQTNRPYTPAEGINIDVGDPANPNKVVHVRNLALISYAPGEGIVSGSIVTADRDALTAVSGTPIKVDGTEGAQFTGTIPNTVSIANGAQVVLTDQPPITVKSADLMAGLDAIVTLAFQNAGEVTLRVPVVDGNESQYVSLKPTPTPSV
jgi:hypothetical protein